MIVCETSPSSSFSINQSLRTGNFPNKLKIAKVIPILQNGNAELINKHGPISLLPTISKIFKTVSIAQLYEYREHHHYVTDSQYILRRGHSAFFTAVELIDRTANILGNNIFTSKHHHA